MDALTSEVFIRRIGSSGNRNSNTDRMLSWIIGAVAIAIYAAPTNVVGHVRQLAWRAIS